MSDDHPEERDPVIEEYLKDPDVQRGLDQIKEHERASRIEAMSPADHQRRLYGKTDEERQPTHKVRMADATPEDFESHLRGEVELVDDDDEQENP
jgi:hypothetical protein